MSGVNHAAAIQFLTAMFEPWDSVAFVLKSHERNVAAQRVGTLPWVGGELCQQWLRRMNCRKCSVFVSVNAIAPGRRSRTREDIGTVRHVFLDADADGAAVVSRVEARPDLPPVSYVLHASPNHVHLLWRVTGFDHDRVERLQKQLAAELSTDPAATPVTQCTRLPGFFNHKRTEPYLVTVEYRDAVTRYRPDDFPAVKPATTEPRHVDRRQSKDFDLPVMDRARRYLASVPPAISGHHGDVHTFRVCCRLVRGFALDDEQALHVLAEWNARCEPPWSEAELLDKLRRAARYGREPIGGLL